MKRVEERERNSFKDRSPARSRARDEAMRNACVLNIYQCDFKRSLGAIERAQGSQTDRQGIGRM